MVLITALNTVLMMASARIAAARRRAAGRCGLSLITVRGDRERRDACDV